MVNKLPWNATNQAQKEQIDFHMVTNNEKFLTFSILEKRQADVPTQQCFKHSLLTRQQRVRLGFPGTLVVTGFDQVIQL